MAPESTLDQARAFGAQLRAAAPLARGVLAGSPQPARVVVCGLGGSAAGARLVLGLYEHELRAPVMIPANPGLPAFVDSSTLVIVVSYSGATREALDWWQEAGRRGAVRVALCSGGELFDDADRHGERLVRVEAGYQPRGAFGLLLAPILVLLAEAGVIGDVSGLIERGADAADAAFAGRSAEAREAARRLDGRVSVLYGAGAYAAAAVRVKNQLNENAKAAAFAGVIPEVAHNEILGWLQHRRAPQHHTAVFLRDADEPAATRVLTDALAALVSADRGDVETWHGDGADVPSRVFSVLAFGDMVSLHLAALAGVDDADISRLTDLKAQLRTAR